MTTRRALRTTALALACLPLLAHAGRVEDAWRAFLDKNPKFSTLAAQPYGGEVTQPTVTKRTDALPLGRDQYAVFVVPGCKTCDAAVAGVKRGGAKVEVFDITRNKTAREAFAATGAKGVPATLLGRYLITGWSRKAYERAMVNNVQDDTREAQGN